MNIFVFLIRLFTGLLFVISGALSLDPTLSEGHPEYHPGTEGFIASLFLAFLYLIPLFVEAKRRKVVYTFPTSKSFTRRRFLIFTRWYSAAGLGLITVEFFWQLQFGCGILALIIVACMMPPLDRMMFAPKRRLKHYVGESATLLKIFPNVAMVGFFIAGGFFTEKNYHLAFITLLVSVGSLLIVPIALLAQQGWKFRNLKSLFLPAPADLQMAATGPGDPQSAPSNPPAKRKYYSARSWYWNYPVAKEYRHHPPTEESFNALVKGFERSWLEAKGYHQKKIRHPDPALYTRGLIAEADAYIQSMHKRFELKTFNKLFTKGYLKEQFIPDEVARVWSADKKLRSLYRALKRYCETPNKMNFNSFGTMAPHIAEYRGMINLVKHLKHALYRMPGQMPLDLVSKTTPTPISSPAPLAVVAIISSLISKPATALVSKPDIIPTPVPAPASASIPASGMTSTSVPPPASASIPASGTTSTPVPAPASASISASGMTSTSVPPPASASIPVSDIPPASNLTQPTAGLPDLDAKSGSMPMPEPTNDIAPIVFLSYSWDSQEHENWVVRLATLLCENGVNAILDKWDLGPLGKPLPHFMETSITRSQRVICVMTPNYKKKTENLTGGVGYEYSIISAEIFGKSTNTSKFIPLFRNGTDADAIPAALKGRKYVDMRDDLHFEEKFVHELLRDIFDEPKFKKPAIGNKPKF